MSIKYTDHSYAYPRTETLVQDIGVTVTQKSPVIAWSDQVSSVPVSDYRKKITLAQQATSPRSGEKAFVKSRTGTITMRWQFQLNPPRYRTATISGHLLYEIGLPTLPSSSLVNGADQVAREIFYARYRKANTAFQGGVALGELRESLSMLRNPARALRSRVTSLYQKILKNKRKAGKKVNEKNRYLSETWLEGTFGWVPLINDIRGAHEAFAKRWDYIDRQVIVLEGKHSVKSESFFPNKVSLALSNTCIRGSAAAEYETMVRYKGAIKCEAISPFVAESRYWGFAPEDIVPTIWELMPYSFLIDYFTNIGKVIDAVSMRRCRLSWGVRTIRRSAISHFVDGRNASNTNVVAVLNKYMDPGDWHSGRSSFTRTPIETVPIPSFGFRVPGYTTQWVNIAALARIKATKF